MAGKEKPAQRPDAEDAKRPAPKADPLASEAGRKWLQAELAQAEREEANGPGGQGWTHNETRRPAIVERAEFLRALIAKL